MHGIHRILKLIGFLRFRGNHRKLSEVRDALRFCGFPPGARRREGEAKTVGTNTIFVNLCNWVKKVPPSLKTDRVINA